MFFSGFFIFIFFSVVFMAVSESMGPPVFSMDFGGQVQWGGGSLR